MSHMRLLGTMCVAQMGAIPHGSEAFPSASISNFRSSCLGKRDNKRSFRSVPCFALVAFPQIVEPFPLAAAGEAQLAINPLAHLTAKGANYMSVHGTWKQRSGS